MVSMGAQKKLKRTLAEIACMAHDEADFQQRLARWRDSDAGLRKALMDRELVDEIAGQFIRMFQTLRTADEHAEGDGRVRYLRSIDT